MKKNSTERPKTGTREEWLVARKKLLEREKELTRHSDELARLRRELPWVLGVKPTSGRLEEAMYYAESQRVRKGARYLAEVEFDKGEMWKVRVVLEGKGWEGELNSEVEATPDGSIGPIAVLIYALPFIGLGIIWIRAIIGRRREE